MPITLQVGGKRYGNWTEVEVTRSLEDLSGTFRFVAASDYKLPFPVPRGQSVKVFIGKTQVMDGYVDKINVSYDSRSHNISIDGRDKTADIVDSKVDHKIEFQAPITLEEVIQQTLQAIGASSVKVINKVSDLTPFEKGDLVSANIGQTAFAFMDQYCKKRQVVMTTDGYGNLVITRASTESTNIKLNNVVGGDSNNIRSANASYDDSNRFNTYAFYSQGNPSGDKDASESSEQLTTRTQTYIDSDVRESRKYHEIAESSSNNDTIKDRAKWEGQIRKAKAFKYTCDVVGHAPTEDGECYQPNTLVQVADDFCDVRDELLVLKVISKLSVGSGSITTLELVTKEAFALLAQEAESKASKEARKGSVSKGGKPVRSSKYEKEGVLDDELLDLEFSKYEKKKK